MIPEIDIWRAAQLMLNRYGHKALEESAGTPIRKFAAAAAPLEFAVDLATVSRNDYALWDFGLGTLPETACQFIV